MRHFHVPNSTYTKSIKQKMKNRRLGVVPGPPDLFVLVGDRIIAIEMKRRRGGQVTPAQAEWIEALNNVGVAARVCKGSDAAIEFINETIILSGMRLMPSEAVF